VDHDGPVTLSREQFEQLLGSVQQSRAELDYAQALGQPQQQAQQQAQDPLDVTLANLPSPAADPDGFRQGLAQLLGAAREDIVTRATASASQANEQVSVFDQAWGLMQQQYPEAAAHPDLVQMATAREMDALRARGLDPMTVLSSNMEEAVGQIAERTMSTINRVRGLPADEDDGGETTRRTEMLSGGSGYRPRPAARQAPSGGLVTEIQKLQREMGIY